MFCFCFVFSVSFTPITLLVDTLIIHFAFLVKKSQTGLIEIDSFLHYTSI